MRFEKWHALGNAYLLVERPEGGAPVGPRLVQRLCDPHVGVGADGLLEVVAADGSRCEIVIWNPDGSTAEVSGNGTRIAARWLAGRTGAEEVTVAAGKRETVARMRGGLLVEQDLGAVDVGQPERLELEGAELTFTPVSVGNPHAVIERPPEREALLELGPLVERHPRFPERTNVQLVRVDGPHELTVRVWERGVGETLASGTSAIAAAAALVVAGRCKSPITVHLPGGDLDVALDEQRRALLTGPAQPIARGEVALELLEEPPTR